MGTEPNVDPKSVEEERAFLHEICNALAISQGMQQLLMQKINKSKDQFPPDCAVKLQKSLDALDKVNALIQARRDLIKS